MLKLAGCFHPSTRLPDEKDLERKPSKKWSKKNKNKTNSRRNSDAQASTLDDVLLLRKEYSYIELIRENNQSLGIIFSGGVDQASPITIQEISPDSIAAKSEAVQVGDVIKAVNGIQTNQLKHEEVANILVNAGPVISLQLEFDSSQGPCGFEKSKITCLTLPKENYDYGFSLDGPEGAPLCDEFELRISHIYPCSTVYRLGLLKPGDKLLSINGISLKGASLRDATTLISEGREVASFEVEYPVAIHENLKSAKGPYTLELLRTPGSSLGLSLIGSPTPGGSIIISSIKAGSISDRSGALYIGDQIISINAQNVQGLSVLDSSKLLQVQSVRVSLELLPGNNPYPRNPFFNKDYQPKMSNSDSISQLNSSTADYGFRPGALSSQSIRSTMTLQRLPARQESLIVQLNPTLDGYGIGIDTLSHPSSGHVIIASIDYNSPAYQCGVLMEGDHILTINDHPIQSTVQCQQLIQDSIMQNKILDLLVELDVNEAVTPSSGTFNIKLMRSGLPSLGITLNGPVQGERGAIWIAKIKKGGIAFRSGGLQIGDVLLAINGQSLTNCTLNDAVQLLQETEDVVTLKISKEAQLLGPKLCEFNSITYTVELPKDKGNLGISIRGTSTAGSSVIVSHLMDGGVASRTEAIHVGDEILSVNGVSVKDKSLLDCARMLEEAEIVVALQIRKPDPLVKDSMLAQQYNTDYHVQCAVASPIPDPRDRIKHDIQSVAPTHQTNHGPPPIRAKPQLNSVTSYPIDSYRLAQETALRGRGRIHPTQHPLEPSSLNSHLPHTDYSNRKSTDLHSTSLTNITHLDRGSSMDSEGSSMYNSSPSPPQKKVSHQPREPSNLTKFVGGTHVPVRLHRSVETLPNSIEMVTFDPKKINKSRTMERGRTGIRDCHFTPVHEMDELGVYSIPLDQEPNEALTDQQIPDQSSAPALPRRNQALPSEQTQILSSRSVSGATWLDVPIKEAPPLPRIVATAQPSSNYVTLNTENGHTDTNNSQIQIQQRFRQPSFDSDIKKHSNQEVMKVQLYKQEKQSFGFSISDGNGNMGVFVKNVDAGSAADRGDLKPLDKLLAINGITIKELDCNRTLKLLKSSKDNLELVVSRLHLSAQNQTL